MRLVVAKGCPHMSPHGVILVAEKDIACERASLRLVVKELSVIRGTQLSPSRLEALALGV